MKFKLINVTSIGDKAVADLFDEEDLAWWLQFPYPKYILSSSLLKTMGIDISQYPSGTTIEIPEKYSWVSGMRLYREPLDHYVRRKDEKDLAPYDYVCVWIQQVQDAETNEPTWVENPHDVVKQHLELFYESCKPWSMCYQANLCPCGASRRV